MSIEDAIAIVTSVLVAGLLIAAIVWLIVTMYRTRPVQRFTVGDHVWSWSWRLVGGYRVAGRDVREMPARSSESGWTLENTSWEASASDVRDERSPSGPQVEFGDVALVDSPAVDVAHGCAEMPHHADTSGACEIDSGAED